MRSPVPFTPMVQQARGTKTEALKDPNTCDTRLSAGSYAAARRAAGSVVRGIDEVLKGACRNALCIVRPPGHHAGIKGLIPGSPSCGFCVFNSIMVGAAHALKGPAALSRVAIVDFDVSAARSAQCRPQPMEPPPRSYIYIYICIYVYMYIYIYTYIYRSRWSPRPEA